MMPKKEISRIPYPAKQRLSLWLQLHPIPEMQHQLPHLIATRMVLHFLWIIRPTLDGLHYAGRQWGVSYESQTLTLPIQSKILVITGMHEGNTKQTVSYSQSENKWVGSDKSLCLFYIAICK